MRRSRGARPARPRIGRDVDEAEQKVFAVAHGYPTRAEPFEECRFDTNSFDGVFIWNCFEQIADPKRLLNETRRVLQPDGVLVIRTPNADFYRSTDSFVLLGHANLLGFPHLYGYTTASPTRTSILAFARSRSTRDSKQRGSRMRCGLRGLRPRFCTPITRRLPCRKNRPFNGQEKTKRRERRRRHRLANSCARRWSTSAAANTARDRRNRRSPLACQRRGVRE